MNIDKEAVEKIKLLSKTFRKVHNGHSCLDPAPIYVLFRYKSKDKDLNYAVAFARIHCNNGCNTFPTVDFREVYKTMERHQMFYNPMALLFFSINSNNINDRLFNFPIGTISVQASYINRKFELQCIKLTKDGPQREPIVIV
jgi:hypothetical protein